MRLPPAGEAYTRRYSVVLPWSWFSTASSAGSIARVSTALVGGDSNVAEVVVHGTPIWFSQSIESAGIAAYMTADASGHTPAETMRLGDIFYLQLYAHTGGQEMSSFEVRIVEDANVCQVCECTHREACTRASACAYNLPIAPRDAQHARPPGLTTPLMLARWFRRPVCTAPRIQDHCKER